MVHGPIQSALISTGLRLESTSPGAEQPEDLVMLLEKSPASLHACSEVVREGINNAIFHGNATDIDITVTTLNSNTVQVRVEDNGSGPSPRRTPGVGSDLLNTVSSGWNLLRVGDTTVLTANLFVTYET
jgi:signal transduction histidine kinase